MNRVWRGVVSESIVPKEVSTMSICKRLGLLVVAIALLATDARAQLTPGAVAVPAAEALYVSLNHRLAA